jgi:hypothetical protein
MTFSESGKRLQDIGTYSGKFDGLVPYFKDTVTTQIETYRDNGYKRQDFLEPV